MSQKRQDITAMTYSSIGIGHRNGAFSSGGENTALTGEVSHLPWVHEDAFAACPQAAYEVALLAVGETVYRPEAFRAARQLRYNKYTELGWLPKEVQDSDGGEHDEYDAHAAQFAVLRNTPYGARLIATSRLIIRNGTVLPVEKDYPEIYADNPVAPGELEASRLISDSKNRPERALATFALERAMVGWGLSNNHTIAHAMVEGYLLKRFDETHLPYTRMSSNFKEIPEYANTKNMAIKINAHDVIRKVKIAQLGVPIATSLFFWRVAQNQGLGFYGNKLIWRYNTAEGNN